MADLYLDHVLIAVRDLEKARRTYANLLGFTVTPAGLHPGRGTENRLIVFRSEYLELIGVRDPREARRHRPQILEFLEGRQGLYMFALGSRDLEATVAEVRHRGGRISDPVDGARAGVVGKGGYTWRSADLAPADTPGSSTFIIQHHHTIQQRYTEPANPTVHANGVTGIFSLSLAVRDASTAATAWCRTLGLTMGQVVEDEANQLQSVRVALGNCYLEFVSPRGDGPLARHLEAHGESPYSLCLRVIEPSTSHVLSEVEGSGRSLCRTTAQLTALGVWLGSLRHTSDGPRRAISEDQTEGVNLELVQPG